VLGESGFKHVEAQDGSVAALAAMRGGELPIVANHSNTVPDKHYRGGL